MERLDDIERSIVDFSAHLAAHHMWLRALYETHPDREAVIHAFQRRAEIPVARALARDVPDAFLDRLQAHCQTLIQEMRAASPTGS